MGSLCCCFSGGSLDEEREPLLDGPKNTLAKGESSKAFFAAMEENHRIRTTPKMAARKLGDKKDDQAC